MTDLLVVADAVLSSAWRESTCWDLLHHLYGKVLIPVQMFEELQISEDRPV